MSADTRPSPHEPHREAGLDAVEHWFQAVITHPGGVTGGVASDEARRHISVDRAALERVIRRSTTLTAEERLGIYAGAYYARLLDCLGEQLPALKRAVGDEVFNAFAFEYLQHHPSTSATLNRLGDHFPDFLAANRPDLDADDNPPATPAWPDLLVELARLDLVIAEVFDGPGVEGAPALTAGDLADLTPEHFAAARLEPVPCLRLLTFRYPVNAYYTELRRASQDEEPVPPTPARQHLAITRRDFVVRRYPLDEPQHALLSSLLAGATVGEAIAAAGAVTELPDHRLAALLRSSFATWVAAPFFAAIT